METKYGIISDAHGASPGLVKLAVKVLKEKGVDGLVLNGDLVGDRATSDAQGYLINMLLSAGRSGLETHVLFGSHEKVADVEPVLLAYREKYSNLIREPKIEKADHDLVFLEGSDFLCGGEYNLVSKEGPASGFYTTDDGPLKVFNMDDLREYASSPEKTVLFSHVPARFDGVGGGVDSAEFGDVGDQGFNIFSVKYKDGRIGSLFLRKEVHGEALQEEIRKRKVAVILDMHSVPNGSVIPLGGAEQYLKAGMPITLMNENRGNSDLGALLKELGVRKHVTGHFHESAHRAHDGRCGSVKEGEFVDELFWNASYLDGFKVGVLTVKDNLVAYENVDLSGYVG